MHSERMHTDRDKIAAQMAANAEEGSPKSEQEGEDPSVFKSQAKGANLHKLTSQMDIFEEDIQRGTRQAHSSEM